MTTTALPRPAPPAVVGVFDSGVGGLSVLRALLTQPCAPLIYLADSAHAPYGERSTNYVIERSVRIGAHLINQGATTIVIACNTATAAAIAPLRQRWPHVAWVGIEPGIQPALQHSTTQRIGVMATPSLLASLKFQQLLARQPSSAIWTLQPCPGLAALIEQGELNAPALVALVEHYCQPLRAAQVDTVVLGCTHYPFAAPHIQNALGAQVRLIDTAHAVARQTLRLLDAQSAGASAPPSVQLQTTGEPAMLTRLSAQWLGLACTASLVTA
jgi:glutamate racemase